MTKAARRRTPPASADAAVYVYALVRSAKAPALGRLPSGLPGASKPRTLEVAPEIWAVVADAPLEQYAGDAIEAHLRDMDWVAERAVGHEAVVEALARKLPTIPMKLFTLFSGEERAVGQLRPDRARLSRVFDRVAGSAEWGLRVSFDELGAKRSAKAEARAEAGQGASGTAFLLQKKKEKDVAKQLLHRAQSEVDALFGELTRAARMARRRPPGQAELGARILLEAAFLVPEKEGKRFAKLVAARQKALAPAGYTVKLTGPWPAYNFVADNG